MSASLDHDTIAAIATPPGRGGIGVVRLSGSAAGTALKHVLTLKALPEPRRATFTQILDRETGAVVDEAVVTYFTAPNSYTGEDVLEVTSHGAPVVLDYVLGEALKGGARLARPGEFTERAFLNGRLDLTQAEAVRDLIEATTLYQARLAAEQLGGGLSRRIGPVKQVLLELIAGLEAGIDFAEDDIDVMPNEEIARRLAGIAAQLETLAGSFEYGRLVHGGVTLAIVGPPNAGKSSLFNRLLDRDRAIVTATPGTTRDVVAERVAIGGVPVELLDTAGLRAAADEAEALGIARTHEALAMADLILLVSVAGEAKDDEVRALGALLAGRAVVQVRNKIDLAQGHASPDEAEAVVKTSALTGEGVQELREEIARRLQRGGVAEGGLVTNRRQYEAIRRGLAAVRAAQQALGMRVPHEMLMIDLRAALEALDELTGTTTSDDVLRLIFSTFCIGK